MVGTADINGCMISRNLERRKNMKFPLMAIVLILLSTSGHANNDGRSLFTSLCASCHAVEGPPTAAPPIFGVKRHLIRHYPDKASFVDRIESWVASPDHKRALMPGAVRRFGLMPKLPYDREQVRKVAAYIYDTEFTPPRGRHHQRHHGQQRSYRQNPYNPYR